MQSQIKWNYNLSNPEDKSRAKVVKRQVEMRPPENWLRIEYSSITILEFRVRACKLKPWGIARWLHRQKAIWFHNVLDREDCSCAFHKSGLALEASCSQHGFILSAERVSRSLADRAPRSFKLSVNVNEFLVWTFWFNIGVRWAIKWNKIKMWIGSMVSFYSLNEFLVLWQIELLGHSSYQSTWASFLFGHFDTTLESDGQMSGNKIQMWIGRQNEISFCNASQWYIYNIWKFNFRCKAFFISHGIADQVEKLAPIWT